jgi:hypothetical protein
VKFTPEDLEKLQTKQLANCIRKLNAGKTLTAREQQMLDDAKASPVGSSESDLNFVRNWDDLAQALNVSRKSVQNWRNREDLRSAKDFPRPRPDGRHDVGAWRRFMIAHELNRADEEVEGSGDGERKSVRDWKIYREELQCQEIERRIAKGDDLLLVATDLEVPIGATFATIQTKLSQFPSRVARFMLQLRDEASAEERLRDEMDAVLMDLNLARYLDGAAAEVAASFPFNDECAELYAKVSFAGQDRALFVELIERCVTEALRLVGSRALAASPEPSETVPPETRDTADLPAAPATARSQVQAVPRKSVSTVRKKKGKSRGGKPRRMKT